MPEINDIVAQNITTVERFLAGTHSTNIEDLDIIHETVDPEIICHGFPNGMNPHDHESYKDFFRTFQQSFSDMTLTADALVADKHFVAVKWRVSCVHSGSFAGAAPSGKPIEFDGMVLYRMKNGRIAETWLQPNELSLLTQAGVLPAPNVE